jgi:hypothetical protein
LNLRLVRYLSIVSCVDDNCDRNQDQKDQLLLREPSEVEVEMFHWGFGIHGLRMRLNLRLVPVRTYLSYLASMIIVTETRRINVNI